MAINEQSIVTKKESVLLNVEKISNSIGKEDLQTLMDVINAEIGNHKLDKEEIEQLKATMSVEAAESEKWNNVADVLKYISIFAIAENNPEAIKKILKVLLNILGIKFPLANTASGLITKVPNKLFTILIQIGGLASPEYLLYRGAKMIAEQKRKEANTQTEQNTSEFESMDTLIIVSKNKLLSSEMDRLINLEDDIDEENIVGTKDGTVHVIVWNESAWEAYRDKLTQNDKVLLIGNVKNSVPLTSEQVCYEEYGVKYGWSNNIAKIEAEPGFLSGSKNYNQFLSALDAANVSRELKKDMKFKFDWVAATKLALFPPLLLGDLFREDVEVKKQQLLYGLYHFYMHELDEFLNSQENE